MPYEKPFREIEQLVDEIQDFGMLVPDSAGAAGFFRRVGYYRSGAYRYVFREMLPADEQDLDTRTFRRDTYVTGSSLIDVMRLEGFDSQLRDACLIGLSDFEIRVRAAIAHVLARRDVFAHTSIAHLDQDQANIIADRATQATKFDEWERTFKSAINSSKQEDFIAHLLVKYGHPLPIWATVDVLSFGSLPFLFEILRKEDRQEIASLFGVKKEKQFSAWLRSMVDFRNYCAHGSRLFNRHFKRDVRVHSYAIDPTFLAHLAGPEFSVSERPHSRLYINAALLSYMLRKHASGSRWHLRFKTAVKKIPKRESDGSLMVDAEFNMGFPPDWNLLPLWQD